VPPAQRGGAAPRAVPDLDVGDPLRSRRPSAVPDLDVDAMAAAALAPRPSVPELSFDAVPPSSRGRSASPAGAPPPRPMAPVASEDGDVDDFDMEIERNIATTAMSSMTSAPPSGAHGGGRTSGRAGLELAAPSRMAREAVAQRHHGDQEPSTGEKIAGLALSVVIAGGAAFALFHYVHHARGIDVTRTLPHAFDGTSATESGALSLVSLVVAVVLAYAGLKLRPYAWAIVAAAGAMLLLTLAMVTVTLASTGENPTPPDGALLVPYLLPAALLMLGLGIVARAARLFALGGGARRGASVPVAAIAGAILFIAFEASRFAR
jgi:hypothetical protein